MPAGQSDSDDDDFENGSGMDQSGTVKEDSDSQAQAIIKMSLFVAFGWWGFGLYTVLSTGSLAVLASLVDATIDLAAQGVLLGANMLAEREGVESVYPVGVARLEPIGVIVCATLMVLASGAVIWDSGYTLITAYPDGPQMDFTLIAGVMLAVVVVVKIVVWRVAKAEYDKTNNVSLEALALDNFNDILSNFSALLFAGLTCVKRETWWMDPVGGILISLYIIRSWFLTASEQSNMLVGVKASEEFLNSVIELAEAVNLADVDVIRAYHFGPKCMVEVKLVMAMSTSLKVIRDTSIKLQHQIEGLEDCERCFVQVDYMHRDKDDHDTNVPLSRKLQASKKEATRSLQRDGLKLRAALSIGEQRRKHSSFGAYEEVMGPGARRRARTVSGSMDVKPL